MEDFNKAIKEFNNSFKTLSKALINNTESFKVLLETNELYIKFTKLIKENQVLKTENERLNKQLGYPIANEEFLFGENVEEPFYKFKDIKLEKIISNLGGKVYETNTPTTMILSTTNDVIIIK